MVQNLKIADSNKFILRLLSDSLQRNIYQNEEERSVAAFIEYMQTTNGANTEIGLLATIGQCHE